MSYMYSVLLKNCFGKGLFQVKVQAMNAFSSFDVDVDLESVLQACQSYSEQSPDEHEVSVCHNDLYTYTLYVT